MSLFKRPSIKLSVGLICLVLTSLAIGLAAGRWLKSPAQILAEAAPPPPTVLTHPVELSTVTRTLTFDARIQRKYSQEVTAKSTDGATPVLTRIHVKEGDTVNAGDVIAEVSGNPIFVFEGAFPAYRDLSPQVSGPDVRQLNRALDTFFTSKDSFDTATSSALSTIYDAAGYTAITVGEEEVLTAEEGLRLAKRALESARVAKAGALQVRYAEEDLNSAQQRLESAQKQMGVKLPLGALVFVKELPAQVTSLDAQLGTAVEGPLMSLASGPVVVAGLPVGPEASEIQRDDHATILLAQGGELEARVGRISQAPKVPDSDELPAGATASQQVSVLLIPDTVVGRKLLGTPTRVSVILEKSNEGLRVPFSAVAAGSSGETFVTVVDRSGKGHRVDVAVGAAGDGHVIVVPLATGALTVGMDVAVGLIN